MGCRFGWFDKTLFDDKEANMAAIEWIATLEDALTLAKSEKKPVLLDFYNPN